ncbi:MAG: hypothetical protein HC933_13100 [Pleurocapsa sp. SU_196_0]|nr:hypothetical protein [Pleurocapsa sp. SU_196_0]
MKKNAEEMRPEYDFSKAKRIVPPYDQRPSSHEPRVTVHRAMARPKPARSTRRLRLRFTSSLILRQRSPAKNR